MPQAFVCCLPRSLSRCPDAAGVFLCMGLMLSKPMPRCRMRLIRNFDTQPAQVWDHVCLFLFARNAYSYFLIETNYFSRICTWTVAVWVELHSYIMASLNNQYVAYLRRTEFPTIKIIYVHGYVQCLLGCFSFCKQPPQWHETTHRFAPLANNLAKQSPS